MSRDIPIIFSAPMVLALLAGRKTMTRRLLKPQTKPAIMDDGMALPVTVFHGERERPRVAIGRCITTQEIKYAPGDRLWVRENYRIHSWDEDGRFWVRYMADGTVSKGLDVGDGDRAQDLMERVCSTLERKGTEKDSIGNFVSSEPLGIKPSIHMPRWASRLTLVVAETKIERLQDITEDDAKAEGATQRHYITARGQTRFGWSMNWPKADADCEGRDLGNARMAFGNFICELHNGPRWNLKPTNLWDQNPEVVALTFDVRQKNIDALAAIELDHSRSGESPPSKLGCP